MWDIHEVGKADLAAIASLEEKIFADAWSARSLQETYLQKHTVILGAYEDGRLLGYAIVYCVPDEAEIARIAVAEQCRRKGAAGQMLCFLEQKCRDRGIARLLLDVRAGNLAALAFYKNYGFCEDGVRKNFYTNPSEHAALMSKRLS